MWYSYVSIVLWWTHDIPMWIVLRWILFCESLNCRNLTVWKWFETNTWHFHFRLFRNVDTKIITKTCTVFGQVSFFNYSIVWCVFLYSVGNFSLLFNFLHLSAIKGISHGSKYWLIFNVTFKSHLFSTIRRVLTIGFD